MFGQDSSNYPWCNRKIEINLPVTKYNDIRGKSIPTLLIIQQIRKMDQPLDWPVCKHQAIIFCLLPCLPEG